MKQVNCIMLIDDNKIDNFFHERVIKKCNAANVIIVKESGEDALDHLRAGSEAIQPDVIFLDINMPGMDGWEFIELYKELAEELRTAMIVIMLSTSENPDDRERAKNHGILADYRSKPLTQEILEDILTTYNNS